LKLASLKVIKDIVQIVQVTTVAQVYETTRALFVRTKKQT